MNVLQRLTALALFFLPLTAWGVAGELQLKIVDSVSRRPLPARVYLQAQSGEWFHLEVDEPSGSAVRYDKRRAGSDEVHTTVSANVCKANLPPGRYTLTIERGKEYHTARREFEIHDQRLQLEVPLRRWANMASRGWYSGDTHVHRRLAELPNVILADDLNVALPLTYWVTDSEESPAAANKNPESVPAASLIRVDDRHVIWPVNTEYEIFTVRGNRHTLGALFFLNHRDPLTHQVPPIAKAVQEARSQPRRVLLDLDKHNWPWSVMLVPTAGVNLFELSNNHIWRAPFRFDQWYPEYSAEYMQLPMTADGRFTEQAWIEFGFRTYYALLNCGFDLKPSAGTASGVHPVPLGFGRVYVHLPDGFDYDAWIEGLAAGRSFVTTGPLLTARCNGQLAGARIRADAPRAVSIEGQADSAFPLERLELIVNGEVAHSFPLANDRTDTESYSNHFQTDVKISESSWIAVRCFERRPDARLRFAHTGPVHVEIEGRPMKAPSNEVEYLVGRVQRELDRHRAVLSEAALAEYESALDELKSRQ